MDAPTPAGLPAAPRSRIAAAVVALAVFVAAGLFAWRAFRPAGQPADDRSRASVAADPLAAVPVGWTEFPGPPERSGSATVWAGDELIAWGGYRYDEAADTYETFADGYALDPATGAWEPIPPAPDGRDGAKAVWTGTEALFLFGEHVREGGGSVGLTDGVAFDPSDRSWRPIAPAPIEPRHGGVAVWTGTEVVVWGGGERGDEVGRTGAAYDPVRDTWRPIADAPIALNLVSGVWTGEEVIVFGSLLDKRNYAETHTSVGAAYYPVTDRWRELPPSDLSPQATSAVWTGDRMVAWDYEVHSQSYDPVTDRWTAPERMPLSFSECYPDSVGVQGLVFAWFCGDAALYDPATGEWGRVHGGLLEPIVEADGNAYQLWRFATLVSAGDVLFFDAQGITVNDRGVPCYGCYGSPASFWAYRPGPAA